ncbi:DegT/DnrJ/EryC1/StrS family aminotransferase [Phytohabitans rumicis]|uniref:Pyridoxal-5'-phosphate-dependent protein n=1 Tax=Phytohabitans rumicis TaxID=1076125 RepID=A0A6V8KSX2_9ACTN|nr:aminotransferase class I/II-fold pyridoxal phosphate-dependent enzyme [Phytohabitans rumicis]GFJ88242.1 pyridoxal-5'-phosphate-dependent protein [Phytohabitans rumicis]
MAERIYLSPPDVGELEEAHVLAAMRSGWVAPVGPDVDAFEIEVARRVGVDHAVAVNSGTAALHLALLALGIGPHHRVLVPTLTFVATANVVRYVGAEPVFVDCDPGTGNVDPALVAELVAQRGRHTRALAAVLTVDLYGSCAEYRSLLPICEAAGLPVVADAAESFGSVHGGRAAGSFGRVAALSFNGNKIITTSGGGMLLTDDAATADRARHLARQARVPGRQFDHTDVGYQYQLSNLLAAMGRAQLHRANDMMARRREIREGYAKLFAAVPGVRLLGAEDRHSNCWLTAMVVDAGLAGWSADLLGEHLERHDIEARPLFKPLHLLAPYAGSDGLITGSAERLFRTGLVLPSGSALTEGQVDRVHAAISTFLEDRG